MKTKLIFLLVFLIAINMTLAHRYFGQGIYGQGNFGTNTDPDISAYQPIDLTPDINTNTNLTFNVTGNDLDLDALSYNWTINGTHNFSGGNFSFFFNITSVYNVSVNVSDNLSHTFVSWIVAVTVPTITPAVPAGGGEGAETAILTEGMCTSQGMLWYNEICYECDGTIIEMDGKTLCAKCPEPFVYDDGMCKTVAEQKIQIPVLIILIIAGMILATILTTKSKRQRKKQFKKLNKEFNKEKTEAKPDEPYQ